ncbi:uncharacterized protein LOC110436090 isoform X2 [Sorghum bicolor]|uniref:uncharacterized protein LOC110436090 isoform X2 n=1 Tax=Sorghum bicolor TaxID=4558 RepID=UPI00081ACD64|nr:uncharacterized protein LOC110436090 isoform X2 [Sorghum bicolor]|eukprot:XP_021317916.1 uncharacterized protein LOC110436090 isoform X2 [Sorghum bicolor]
MSSVGSQDSMDSLDYSYLLDGLYLSDGLVEAPTLTSKEIEDAREALKILKTSSPEEALKIFTESSEVIKADLAREKAHTPAMPPNGADAKANGTVQHPPPKN